jgi:CRISPR-associated endonuclease/helicase Cas3
VSDFFAHTDGPRRERLIDHLRDVAALAAKFSSSFDAGEWGHITGLWHDLGKYSGAFQEYLHATANDAKTSARKRGPDHATAGAQHAVARFQGSVGAILAYCIAGHHGGLPDAEDPLGGLSGLNARLRKHVEPFDGASGELLDTLRPPSPALNWGKTESDYSFRASVFCRMLFSCLVDGDFLATEAFMRPDRAASRGRSHPPLQQVLDVLDAHLFRLSRTAKPTSVNARRKEVLAACRDKADLPPGLFSLTVPTGGGKTLSSLAFALTHAVRHGQRRVIYAIPYTSIIEQNVLVFRKALSAAGDNVVLEHHSNFDPRKSHGAPSDFDALYWDCLAAENWDAPIVVTTNVQLFESLFANKPSRCRKLHRIAGSIIVLDEVQTLPVELLRPTLAMLAELCRNYGCTVVLCSATQPAVTLRDDFPIGLAGVREIIDDPLALFTALKRVEVEKVGHLADTEVALRLSEHDQVLCIVNTRRHARELVEHVRQETEDAVHHLSASMCPRHRMAVLRLIRHKLDCGDTCRVVSTQLVEAGVDIDFPVVYRAMTGVDSIAQAAGRCNREDTLNCGRVFIFETDHDPRGDLRLRRQLGREIAGEHDDLLSLESLDHYFTLLYWMRKDEWDKRGIMRLFSINERGMHAQFRQVASKYRLISDEQQAVIVPYGREGKRLIGEIESMSEPPGRGFARRAQRFTVGVWPWDFKKLQDATFIELHHERFWVLASPEAYDKNLGLRCDLTGRTPENLIV